jgi:hypothetical protein
VLEHLPLLLLRPAGLQGVLLVLVLVLEQQQQQERACVAES